MLDLGAYIKNYLGKIKYVTYEFLYLLEGCFINPIFKLNKPSKKNNNMKLILSISVLMLMTIGSYAQIYNITSTASGANEVPPVASAGTATITGTYDAATSMIMITVNYSSLSSGLAAAHLHAGAVGSNGPVIVNLAPTTGAPSGTITGTFPVASADEAGLIAGNVYINLHTPNNPGGELRGQLSLVQDVTDASIPTMGEWGLMALGLLVMIFGVVSIRQRQVSMKKV